MHTGTEQDGGEHCIDEGEHCIDEGESTEDWVVEHGVDDGADGVGKHVGYNILPQFIH